MHARTIQEKKKNAIETLGRAADARGSVFRRGARLSYLRCICRTNETDCDCHAYRASNFYTDSTNGNPNPTNATTAHPRANPATNSATDRTTNRATTADRAASATTANTVTI
jgi:hypothetical protein